MKQSNIFPFVQGIICLIYAFFVLLNIFVFPINLILGIICIFFLPGYNLLTLIKPEAKKVEKLGLSVFFSLAIENILMFFLFVISYHFVNISGWVGYFFWEEMLIAIIQWINIGLLFINSYINKDKYGEQDHHGYEDMIRKYFNRETLLILVSFIVSLIFLCISTYLSVDVTDDVTQIRREYRANFIFFERVPIFFYVFLTTSIICLALIIFRIKNKYLILICISIFLYCVWILPALQIKNYFLWDTAELDTIYYHYYRYGIHPIRSYCFYITEYSSLRYSTRLFTMILFVHGTGLESNLILTFIYPIILVFIPFYFYSVFKKFSENKERNHTLLSVLVVIAIISPLVIKNAHSATAVVIGLFLFYILVVEYFELIYKRNMNLKHMVLIILLYFFLTLTHFEECVYFLLIIAFFTIYYLFFQIKDSKGDQNVLKSSKIFLAKNIFLIGLLMVIFLFVQEFFGYLAFYISVFENAPYVSFISEIYVDSKTELLGFMRGNFRFSPLLLVAAILGIGIYSLILYLAFFRYFNILENLYEKAILVVKKVHGFLKTVISKRIVQILIPIAIYCLFLIFHFFYYEFLEEEGIFMILELVLIFSFMVFNIFIFIKGTMDYKIRNDKQNYFLIAIISCGLLMVLLGLSGDIPYTFSILNSKFITYFIFFNLIIIQNNYFRSLTNKKSQYLAIMIILLLLFGVLYSLRKISYG